MVHLVDLTPHLAPLSRPMIERAAEARIRLIRTTPDLNEVVQDTQAQWFELIREVARTRKTVYSAMTEAIEKQTISSEWLMQELAQFSPQRQGVSPETLSRWRKQGLLCYQGRDKPNYDSAAGLLLLRGLTTKRIPGTKISEQEPLWWCWRQDTPSSLILPCPVPVPADVPSHALLWTTWLGAAWSPAWLAFGKSGAARWAGTHFVGNTLTWNISEQMLEQWAPGISFLQEGIMSEIAPMAMHTLASFVLLKVAAAKIEKEVNAFTQKAS